MKKQRNKELEKWAKQLNKKSKSIFRDNELEQLIQLGLVERKHNKWIDGFEKGMNFFGLVKDLGITILYIITLVTVFWFWLTYALNNTGSPELVNLAATMLNILRLGFEITLVGFLFYWICYFIMTILERRELIALHREGVKNGRN